MKLNDGKINLSHDSLFSKIYHNIIIMIKKVFFKKTENKIDEKPNFCK